jgi:hypothetical protein
VPNNLQLLAPSSALAAIDFSAPFAPAANVSLDGVDAYRASVFCLQPPGDMEGRKAISDSLTAGCIPVIFNEHVMSKKYPWFVSAEEEEAAFLYIPFSKVIKSAEPPFNIADFLLSVPPSKIIRMQQAGARLARRFQISVPPRRFMPQAGSGGARMSREDDAGASLAAWDYSPFKDAAPGSYDRQSNSLL